MTFIVLTHIPRLKMAKKHAHNISHRKWSDLETVGISEKMDTDSQAMGFGSWLADQRGEAAREGQEHLQMWGSAGVRKVGRLIKQQL